VHMDANAISVIAAAVTALVQVVKWQGLPDRWGPVVVLVFAAIGVGVWVYAQGAFVRTDAFAYFSAWVTVALSSAGVFGFTRAAASSVTRATPPPAGGAGSSSTTEG
jgi:hypothetical protein